jgi:threonine dehydratase
VITIEDVRDAAARIAGVIRPTPVYLSEGISKVAGRPVLLKPEQRQRTGSFKIRGAYNKISRLDSTSTHSVVAASAGNHAQGVALAAFLSGIRATIFMPATVSLPKLQATQDYGAHVVLVDGGVDQAITAALDHVTATGGLWVHPFDDPLIIAGQGTIGLEIAAEAPDAEVVVVPVGGGGLVTGIATALGGTRVLGVRPLDPANTMADGIAVSSPLPLPVDTVQVSEEDISHAVLLLLERAKAVVEPAGAVGLAAVLAGAVPGDGPVVVVLSGGNVDPMLLTNIVDHGLSAVGRFLVIEVVLGDRPGQLAALTAAVAEQRANVLSIEHHREGVGLPVGETQVRLTIETRDRDHGNGVVFALEQHGFAVTRG